MRTSAPSSIEGIEKYLASGMIRGIGPVYARKMVKAFGEAVFDVIEAEPDRMREVDGIGPVRAQRITAAWAEQKIVREIMVFLHSHGVGTARAVRIYKTYGADAIQVMTENPCRGAAADQALSADREPVTQVTSTSCQNPNRPPTCCRTDAALHRTTPHVHAGRRR